jgi:hypothetical protein
MCSLRNSLVMSRDELFVSQMESPSFFCVAEAALAGRQSTQYCTNWRREMSVVIPFLLLVIELQSASDNRS